MDSVKYSIVIPLYNEEGILPLLVERLQEIMAQLDGPGRGRHGRRRQHGPHVPARAGRQPPGDPRFKLIQFSRNFGHQVAITAGMDAASGDAVIIMDADLQDPPYVDPADDREVAGGV